MQEAKHAYDKALAIRRKLAEANPDAYLPDVARTLNNLGFFHYSDGRFGEAKAQVSEAESILDLFWQANPEVHGDLMARILWTHALVREATKEPVEACAFARRALAAAWDPRLREFIQPLIDRLDPPTDS